MRAAIPWCFACRLFAPARFPAAAHECRIADVAHRIKGTLTTDAVEVLVIQGVFVMHTPALGLVTCNP